MHSTQCAGTMPDGGTCPWSAKACRMHAAPPPVAIWRGGVTTTDVQAVVYYIGNPDTQLIKIGTTTRLRQRMYDLTYRRPNLLVLATEPGTYPLETRRKRQFRSLNEPLPNGETEWFRKAPLLMQHVGETRLKYGIICPGGPKLFESWIAPLRAGGARHDAADHAAQRDSAEAGGR